MVSKKRFEVTYKSGELIYKQGSNQSHIIKLNKGLAKIYIEGPNNNNLILRYLKSGDILIGPGVFTDYKLHFSVTALSECCFCFIDAGLFRQLIHNNNDLAFKYITTMSNRSIFGYNKLMSLTQKQMHGRIADALMYYYNSVFNDNFSGFSVSRQEFAELTGMSKDSASRILKEFQKSGVINIETNRITILNMELLEQVSVFG